MGLIPRLMGQTVVGWSSVGVICDCHPLTGDEKLEEKEEDGIHSVVKMRVKPSRTSEVEIC